MAERDKLDEIDLVRGMAMLGVLLVHATAWATVQMPDSRLYGVYNFINIFFKFGTTTFLFLSSFVLFYNYYPRKLTPRQLLRFYRNRLLYILAPYFFFSTFYFVFKRRLEGGSWDFPAVLHDFGLKLLMGDAFYHLYFLFVNVQFYILFPLLLLAFQKYKRAAAYACWIGLAVQWAFFIWNNWSLQVPDRGSWALSYFSHSMLGAWLGIHFDRVKAWLHQAGQRAARLRAACSAMLWTVWAAFGVVHAALWHRMRLGIITYPALLVDAVWNVHTLLTALVLMQLAFALNRCKRAFITQRLRNLGVVSFGVYLLHPFVLSVYERFPVSSGQAWLHHLWYAGGFLFTLAVTWGLVKVSARRIPFSWILIGRISAQDRAKTPVRTDTHTRTNLRTPQ